jgi:putative NADH-flavin reductase
MKIIVFGANGATGRELTRRALLQGHQVTAFVRSPAVKHNEFMIAEGDVVDLARVREVIAEQDAVVSVLGNSTILHRNPALVGGIRNIVQAMEAEHVRRFVYLSFIGVDEARQHLGGLLRYLAPVMLRNEIADHEAKERIITSSNLDWVIVRPPKLTEGPWTGMYRHGLDIRTQGILPSISRADVADFMLQQLRNDTYVRRAVSVMH